MGRLYYPQCRLSCLLRFVLAGLQVVSLLSGAATLLDAHRVKQFELDRTNEQEVLHPLLEGVCDIRTLGESRKSFGHPMPLHLAPCMAWSSFIHRWHIAQLLNKCCEAAGARTHDSKR